MGLLNIGADGTSRSSLKCYNPKMLHDNLHDRKSETDLIAEGTYGLFEFLLGHQSTVLSDNRGFVQLIAESIWFEQRTETRRFSLRHFYLENVRSFPDEN